LASTLFKEVNYNAGRLIDEIETGGDRPARYPASVRVE
jgi:hypothetical protein